MKKKGHVLGIDFGASTTGIVLFDGKRILRKKSLPASGVQNAQKLAAGFVALSGKIGAISVTGGKSGLLHGKRLFGIPVRHVSEIDAIGFGGAFVSGKKNCVAASVGTGTCMVEMRNGKARHLGGTGVGGGTLLGLAELLLGTQSIPQLEALASEGDAKKVDLSVGDIIGTGIGVVPASGTGSNFAKLSSRKKKDVAAALVKLVAEADATAIIFAARAAKQDNIVVIGKTPLVGGFKAHMQKVAGYYGKKFVFPKNAGVATALGAAIMVSRM